MLDSVLDCGVGLLAGSIFVPHDRLSADRVEGKEDSGVTAMV